MSAWRLVYCAVLAVFVALAADESSYRSSIERWRQQQETELKADDGWLSVAGLFWLKDGRNTAGTDTASDIALPRGPASAGVFEFHDGRTIFHPGAGSGATVNGQPAGESTPLKDDSKGTPDQVKIDRLTMFVIHRGNRFGIRMRDPDSKLRREFTGLHWFPPKDNYRVNAQFIRNNPPLEIAIPNILGEVIQEASPGYVQFTLEGKSLRLDPIMEGHELFFIFRDETAGKETYPAGRFLKAEFPKNNAVVLDFNKAYNPPCAFTPYATCPLPPKQNRLPIRIEAGEMNYRH